MTSEARSTQGRARLVRLVCLALRCRPGIDLLDTLASLGKARELEDGRYLAVSSRSNLSRAAMPTALAALAQRRQRGG